MQTEANTVWAWDCLLANEVLDLTPQRMRGRFQADRF